MFNLIQNNFQSEEIAKNIYMICICSIFCNDFYCLVSRIFGLNINTHHIEKEFISAQFFNTLKDIYCVVSKVFGLKKHRKFITLWFLFAQYFTIIFIALLMKYPVWTQGMFNSFDQIWNNYQLQNTHREEVY